ncbi:MAG: hypothetical protein AB7P94_16690 [Steroidobacteraceae bacterium]
MKHAILFLIILAAVGTAHAKNDNTGPSNNNGPTFGGTTTVNANPSAAAAAAAHANATGVGVGIGVGGEGGKGGNANATGGSASNRTDVTTNVRNDVAQGQHQAQGQQQQAISGGNKLTNEGNNAAQSTSVVVQGDVTESNTPPVVAGVLPSVPTSCRLYLFGGGSTRDGAGSGTFPIGNDQTCLSIAALNLMERAGGFTQAEKQAVVCKVEGMAEMATCKAIAGAR